MAGPQGPFVPAQAAPDPIDPQLRVGHVHLRTADIDRVRAFYVDIMGFDVIFEARDVPGWGTTGDILFLSAGGYHHHLGFNTWKSAGGPPQPDGVTGLHHVALNFSTRARLAHTVKRLIDAGVPLRQLTDHGTHQAVYLSDPDGNDLELAWDRPFDQWPVYGAADAPAIDAPLDLDDLLAADEVPARGLAPGQRPGSSAAVASTVSRRSAPGAMALYSGLQLPSVMMRLTRAIPSASTGRPSRRRSISTRSGGAAVSTSRRRTGVPVRLRGCGWRTSSRVR